MIKYNPETLLQEIQDIEALKTAALKTIKDTKKAIVDLKDGGLEGAEGVALATSYSVKADKMLSDLETFVNEYVTALKNAASNLDEASKTNVNNIN